MYQVQENIQHIKSGIFQCEFTNLRIVFLNFLPIFKLLASYVSAVQDLFMSDMFLTKESNQLMIFNSSIFFF